MLGPIHRFRTHRPSGDNFDSKLRQAPAYTGISKVQIFDEKGRLHAKATPQDYEDRESMARPSIFVGAKADETKAKWQSGELPAKEAIAQLVESQQDFLRPDDADESRFPTRFAYIRITGPRRLRARTELLGIVDALFPEPSAKRTEALFAANCAGRELFCGRMMLDKKTRKGYGSYGHNSTFIKPWETMAATEASVAPELLTPELKERHRRKKQQLQAGIDYNLRERYVYNNNDMREVDAEESIQLVAIYRMPDGSDARISEVPETRKSMLPEFELLTEKGTGRRVFYDAGADNYRFEDNDEVVGAEHGAFDSRRLSMAELREHYTFRRLRPGESLRNAFRFDWDGNGYVTQRKLDWVGWAGFCDDKAVLEAQGIVVEKDHSVQVYDSASGEVVVYHREHLDDIAMCFSELGGSNATFRGEPREMGSRKFAAFRDDDNPDTFSFGAGVGFPPDPRARFRIDTVRFEGEALAGADLFRHYKLKGERDARVFDGENPYYDEAKSSRDDVFVKIPGATGFKAMTEYQALDPATTNYRTEREDLDIDFQDMKKRKVLVGSVIRRGDAAKQQILMSYLECDGARWYQLDEEHGIRGDKVEVLGQVSKTPLDFAQMSAKHETSLDNPRYWLDFVRALQTTGVSGTAETADGAGVWNGAFEYVTESIDEARWPGEDGKMWERRHLEVKARFGHQHGEYLAELNPDGTESGLFVPIKMPFDFAWAQQFVFAPHTDQTYNPKAYGRGVLQYDEASRTLHSEACDELGEILHCAFHEKFWVLRHQGELFYYETEAAWQEEVDRLAALRTEALKKPEAVAAAAPSLKTDGELGRSSKKTYAITATGDGMLRAELQTKGGDADLSVFDGVKTTGTHRLGASRKWGTAADSVEIPVKKGQTYTVRVNTAFVPSTYALTLHGPVESDDGSLAREALVA